MATWITPKTDWTKSDGFAYTDYNRIKNNLVYINDMLNDLYPDLAVPLDLGNDLDYSANYTPSQFNAFEEALELFKRVGTDMNIGDKKTFFGNSPFIDYNELNRIEKCCFKWYNFNPVISDITISSDSFELDANETKQLTITVNPPQAIYSVQWISSDYLVADVDSNGLVTALASGTATITAIIKQTGQPDKYITATCVVNITATSITVTPSNLLLTYKQPVTFNIVIEPEEAADKPVVATSSNAKIFKVNGNEGEGGVNAGEATVTFAVDNVTQTVNVKNMVSKESRQSTHGLTVHNNRIYITGWKEGVNPNKNGFMSFYDGQGWSNPIALPYRGAGEGAIIDYNNEIHLIGGYYGTFNTLHMLTTHKVYKNGSWTNAASYPINIGIPQMVVWNNEIHVVGGMHSTDNWLATQCGYHYKFNGSSWSYVSTLPQYKVVGDDANRKIVVWNNEIHVFPHYYNDGKPNPEGDNILYHYKWNGSEWIREIDSPISGSYVVFNNKIHVLSASGVNNMKHYEYNGTTWTELDDLEFHGDYTMYVVYNNHLYGIGGNEPPVDEFSYTNAHNMVQIM